LFKCVKVNQLKLFGGFVVGAFHAHKLHQGRYNVKGESCKKGGVEIQVYKTAARHKPHYKTHLIYRTQRLCKIATANSVKGG
jgi:hypothetical protein